MKPLILTTILPALLIATLACLRSPQPIAEEDGYSISPIAHVSPSIDEQIFVSDIIVVASFISAKAAVQTIPGGFGVSPTYRPMQVLTFRATEYLKGTGPTQFTVEVLDKSRGVYVDGSLYEGYLKESDAMTAAEEILTERNTTWDTRSAVLFLLGPLTPASSSNVGASGSSSNQNYGFTLSNYGAQSSFAYEVDTLSRAWLPASETPDNGAEGASENPEYITDGAKNPPPVMSLSSLKTRIGEINAMLAVGEGIEGYERCIYYKLTRERHYRDHTPLSVKRAIDSGLAAGTAMHESTLDESQKVYDDDYNIHSVSGADADSFQAVVKDDDTIASNGYHFYLSPSRPLPADSYIINMHIQHYNYVVCDHNPTENNYITYNVTVTAPPGTLHEAFFDPTAAGTGNVSPASFTVNGTATEITGLTWSDGKVGLSLNPYVSLAGYTLDFIELDGTGSLNLRGLDAFDDGASISAPSDAGTLLWNVASQPWKNGDKLMLRIRVDSAPPPPTPTP